MGLPPSFAGAVHETTAEALPATADTPVGAPGTPATGVTDAEGVEGGLVPMALVAVTVNVYGVPLVRPLTVQGLEAAVQVMLPGDEVTV
jgi:hypothetical protein